MAKAKSKWICQNCGYETAGYLGKCPDCESWGSIVEEKIISSAPKNSADALFTKTKPVLINDITIDESIRFSTGMQEFDRVLGGGFVEGSMVLLAGDPGIGKSTIILQSCQKLTDNGLKVLYVSAEESLKQIKLRATRLNVNSDKLFILAQTNIEEIQTHIDEISPDIVIIDSIQAVYSQNITSTAGSVSQVRECCNLLINNSKKSGAITIIVGHVTKDGMIAGPKILEHMVDTVIYFEGDKYKSFRILRSIKNRFGSTNEVGIFNMEEDGLREVNNASELFLSEMDKEMASGCVVIATNEGTRTLLVEVQALVGPTTYASPRRVATGSEYNRVLQILAVLEKRVGLNLSKHDVYVSISGGIEVDEPAADLGIALAVATCARNVQVDAKTVIIGEISLSGEIRAVNSIESRIKEAKNLGFKKAIVPKSNLPLKNITGIEVIGVSKITEAILKSVSKKEQPDK